MVVDSKNPIISLSTCEDLNLVRFVDEIKQSDVRSSNEILKDPRYKSVFKGLGCIKNVVYDMKMKMKHETKPIVNPPHKVSHRKTEPTEWVNSLVIIEKKSGDLHLCIDPRSLNQGIQREHYLMRTVEDVAACLAGKKVFSVLDAGQAFYQIRVTEASSRLLTFNWAFGRFKYTRMPFGISSASKVWERTITEMFDDIPGVEVVRDDILIAGKDVEEHDAVLRKVVDRALENSEKCRITVSHIKVTYSPTQE